MTTPTTFRAGGRPSATPRAVPSSAVPRWYGRETIGWCYAFLLPGLVLTAMFVFYPMGASWVYSTMDWSGFTQGMTFIGLDNYRELIGDPLFWGAFGRSMLFVLVGVPLRVGLALIVAILLNNVIRGRTSTFFRTVFFMPVMASAAIMGVVLTFVLSPNGGPVNTVLVGSGLLRAPIEFLSDPRIAFWVVLLAHTWKNFGMTLIYWLAALQTVPDDLYEAARVDGANGIRQLLYITLPVLFPFAMVIVVLTANENLHAFALVQAMTGGGPYYVTQVIEVYIYQTAFAPSAAGGIPRLGYASAAGCFFGVATLLIALAQAWAARGMSEHRKGVKGAEG